MYTTQNTFFGKITEVFINIDTVRFTVDASRISDDALLYEEANWDIIDTYMVVFFLSEGEYNEYMPGKFEDSTDLVGQWIRIAAVGISEGFAGVSCYSTNPLNIEGDYELTLVRESITVLTPKNPDHNTYINRLLLIISLDQLYDSQKTNKALQLFDDSLTNVLKNSVTAINFNVGHGNAVGVFDEFYEPLFYIDIGGGVHMNKGTYKKNLDVPLNKDIHIILTHWDSDHFETAYRNLSKFSSCVWIAPIQESSFSIKKFAWLIRNNLVLIKNELDLVRTFPLGKMVRCNGNSRNDSGIAVKLELEKNQDISDILFPGDANYQHIEESLKFVDAINVTHHGGKLKTTDGFPVPRKKGEGFAVYSYGKSNCYGHPNLESVNRHIEHGWGADRFGKKYSLSTTNMNVMYTTDSNKARDFNHKYPYLGFVNCFYGLKFNFMPCRGATHATRLSMLDND